MTKKRERGWVSTLDSTPEMKEIWSCLILKLKLELVVWALDFSNVKMKPRFNSPHGSTLHMLLQFQLGGGSKFVGRTTNFCLYVFSFPCSIKIFHPIDMCFIHVLNVQHPCAKTTHL